MAKTTISPEFKQINIQEPKQIIINDIVKYINDPRTFKQANYQGALMKLVLENNMVSKDDIVLLLLELNPTKTKTQILASEWFKDERNYFKNNWVVKSECKKWIKLNDNLNLNTQEKNDLLELIDQKIKGALN